MRSLVLYAAAVAAAVHAAPGTQYGFLQNPNRDTEGSFIHADAMDVDGELQTPAVATGQQPKLKRFAKRGGLAMLVTGLACAALKMAPASMTNVLKKGAPKGLLGKWAENRVLAVSDDPSQTTWSQGYRAGQAVSKHEIPINGPRWAAAVPGAGPPTDYTMFSNTRANEIPETPSGGTIPGAAPIPSAEPPAGWTWPLKGADITFNDGLIGSVVEFDMKGFGQIHCGCQTNIYLTKAPGNDQPGACDAGGNGYGCYELDFMEGNAQALGTTFHLCGDEHKGDFMCSDDRCLSSVIPGKEGGDECDAWGCATNTQDLPDKDGKAAYGLGGYIDSNADFKMAMYFEAAGDGSLDAAWVKLTQGANELTYKICDADNYIHAYTDAANGPWTTQSTYWGGGDGMEWLNGPCSDFPGDCGGSAADHIQNVQLYKAVTDGAPPAGGTAASTATAAPATTGGPADAASSTGGGGTTIIQKKCLIQKCMKWED